MISLSKDFDWAKFDDYSDKANNAADFAPAPDGRAPGRGKADTLELESLV